MPRKRSPTAAALVGHIFGAIEVLDTVHVAEGVYAVHLLCLCRTCGRQCILKRSYLGKDRALVGCRDCSRKKPFTTRDGLSKHPMYSQWKYMVTRWQRGEIDLNPDWVRYKTGFQNYLADMKQQKFIEDDEKRKNATL